MNELEYIVNEKNRDMLASMLSEERAKKYKWFLRAISSLKYFPNSRIRGEFVEAFYLAMRIVDDVVDGDIPLPEGFASKKDFVQHCLNYASNLSSPVFPIDYLILNSFQKADKAGYIIEEETGLILSSMFFDAKRFGKYEIFSEKDLTEHFHRLDVEGTIKGSLHIFGEPGSKFTYLKKLGTASRIYYNLRDFGDDYNTSGFINIPREAIKKHNVDINLLPSLDHKPLRNWFVDESVKGLDLISQHKKELSSANFPLHMKFVLYALYEQSATRYFMNTLHKLR